MELHGKNIIGAELSQLGSASYTGIDPVDGSALPTTFCDASSAEIVLAVSKSVSAARPYRAVDPERRAAFLERIATEIEGLGQDLLDRSSSETALPLMRLTSERGRTVAQLRMFAGVLREGWHLAVRIDAAEPDRRPLPKPDLRLVHRPLGPVVVFGASNFPLAFSTAGGDTASALAAGCPVIVKAHPAHPGCAEMVATAIRAAVVACDMPEGCFSLLHGAQPGVGRQLVLDPAIKAVGFTGSQAAGRALFNLAAQRAEPIPVFAEMGSLNPVFLLPGKLAADGVALAEGLTQSINLGVGQFCTCPSLVVVQEGEGLQPFLGAIEARFRKVPPGTMLHAGIAGNWRQGLEGCLAVSGVEELSRKRAKAGRSTAVHCMALRTDAKTFLQNPVLHEEVFGPSTLVVTCSDQAEMLQVAEALPGQLTAGVHASDADMAACAELFGILEEKAGRLLFGGWPTGVEVSGAMQHGGPYPATTDSRSTSVGSNAILRFLRPVCYQGVPAALLPEALRGS